MLDYSYKTILKVAIPLMASSFIQSVVLISDMSFLSRHNTLDFAAAGNAGIYYITMFIVMIGLNDAAQILMARRIGEERTERLPRIFGSTLTINFIAAIVLFAAMQLFMPSSLEYFSESKDLAEREIDFLTIRSFGIFFGMITLAINAYFMATGKTRVVLLGALLTAITNIILDYGMIFGEYGLPELGLKGAALASVIAEGTGMLFLFVLLYINKEQKQHQLLKLITVKADTLKEVFRIGSPIMLQGFIALAVWAVFFTWIEQMGTYELTVSQNIRSIYFLTFVPIWGFAATTKTYISQYIGHGSFDKIKTIQRRIQLMTVGFIVLFIHGMVLYPEALIGMINPAQSYIEESASIMRMIFGSIIIFSFISVYFNTISGSGNTRYTFLVELASVTTYIIGAFLLIKVFEVSIYWVWTVEYIYFGTMGILSILYLRYSNWQQKKI